MRLSIEEFIEKIKKEECEICDRPCKYREMYGQDKINAEEFEKYCAECLLGMI